MAECKGRRRGKRKKKNSFFSLLFSSLGRMSGCLQLRSNWIISLSEMNSPRKQLLIMRLQIGCAPAHQHTEPGMSIWKCAGLNECLFLHHRRQVSVNFHYAGSLLLPFSHCLPQGKLYNLKIMSATFLLLHRRHARFRINTSGQTF